MDWEKILTELHGGEECFNYARQLKNQNSEILALIDYMQSPSNKLAWRAGWVVDNFAKTYPSDIIPYIPELIRILNCTKNNSIKRHITRILSSQPPNLYEDGELIENCFCWIIDKNIPIAVKANAMSVAFNLCKIYPELTNELILTIESCFDTASIGVKNRGKKIIKELRSLHSTHNI
jgi:hypothetical protein